MIEKLNALHGYQLGIGAIHRHQAVVVATLDDPALLHYQYLIGMLNGTEPASNDNGGSVLHQVGDGLLHQLL